MHITWEGLILKDNVRLVKGRLSRGKKGQGTKSESKCKPRGPFV